jgi:hypothetical protein
MWRRPESNRLRQRLQGATATLAVTPKAAVPAAEAGGHGGIAAGGIDLPQGRPDRPASMVLTLWNSQQSFD